MDESIEETVVENKPKKKKKWILILGVIILIALCILGGWAIYNKIETDKQNQLLYEKVLGLSAPDMKGEVSMATILIDDYSTVWSNAIKRQDDFSVAVFEYMDSNKGKKLLTGLEYGTDRIKENMQYLQNPPEEYKESYEILKEMYGVYGQLIEQAQSPSGSLIEFNRKTAEYYEEYLKLEDKFYITIPENIEELKDEFINMKYTRDDLGIFEPVPEEEGF